MIVQREIQQALVPIRWNLWSGVPSLAYVETNPHKHQLGDVGRSWETAADHTIRATESSRESNSCSRVVVTALREVQMEPRWQPPLFFPIKQRAISVSESLSSQVLSILMKGHVRYTSQYQSTARRFFRLGPKSTWPPKPPQTKNPLFTGTNWKLDLSLWDPMGTVLLSMTWQCSRTSERCPPWANERGF